MSAKKILIVGSRFFPENSPRAFRTTELAKEFARQGHDVVVITPKIPNVHDKLERENHFTIKDMGELKWKPVKVKGKGLEKLFRRVISRFSKLLFEYPSIEISRLVRKSLKNEKGYDLLISIAVPYPVHWGVALVRSKKKPIAKVWIADCGDPYMGRENDTFKTPFYFSFIEKWFMRKADYITVPTKGSVNGYYPEFHNKIHVIPQGFNFKDVPKSEVKFNNNIPTFAYAGLFIPGRRDPTEFLKYLLSMDIDYKFYLYTKSQDIVKKYVDQAEGKIELSNYIPRQELLEKLSKVDFVVNFDNVGDKQTPSKLIDYALLGKPILSIKTGELNTNVINEFLSGDYSNRYEVETLDQYRIENVCNKFIGLLDGDCNSK